MPHAPSAATDSRWQQVLGTIAGMLPAGVLWVVVDGGAEAPRMMADRLAATLRVSGRPCARLADAGWDQLDGRQRERRAEDTVLLADGPGWRARRGWDVVIWLNSSPAVAGSDAGGIGEGRAGVDIVVDLGDPAWPVIRQVSPSLAGSGNWYISETRAFFGPRAATWDTKFGDDGPAYTAAVAEMGVPAGGTVLDVGSGTGRALPALRRAVGLRGSVIALDLTPEMIDQARALGRAAYAAFLIADARHLPLQAASADAVFAAGLITHLPDAASGLQELARVTRPGGTLALFHPSGRAALAARHGRTLAPDEPLAHRILRQSLRAAGWQLRHYDDAPHRFLAFATRHGHAKT